MQLTSAKIIARREYLARLKSKGFWISTIALPILMAVWMVVPGLMVAKTRAGQRLAIVDETEVVAPALAAELERLERDSAARSGPAEQAISFSVEIAATGGNSATVRQQLDRRVLADEIDAWIFIDDALLRQNLVEYHAESVANFITQQALQTAITSVVRQQRLAGAGYDPEEIATLSRSIALDTIRLSERGSRAEGGLGGFAVAFALFMVLYTTTLVYGQQVMHGVLEEKNSRVVEVMLAAVRPVELMAGKLAGILAAGLTQLGIWFAVALLLTAPGFLALLPFLSGREVLPILPLSLIAHFFGFFLLGYLFYATFYAMIGAAFNNPQEAQQMASVGIVFVVLPWIFFFPVVNDPDSSLAIITSLIPVFTPFLMLLRIAVETPPVWQIVLGYFLTALLCVVMIWLCARVYRVGILMFGKKPTLTEIWRWIRYA